MRSSSGLTAKLNTGAFRKVAQNILLRGIRNLPHSALNPSVSDEQLTFYVQDQRICRSGQTFLIRRFPQLRPETIVDWTWRDYNAVASTLEDSRVTRACVHFYEIIQAAQDLGLPATLNVGLAEETRIEQKLHSSDQHELDEYCLKGSSRTSSPRAPWFNDLVIIRAADEYAPDPLAVATAYFNIITLRPLYFTDRFTNNLLHQKIIPGVTFGDDVARTSRFCILLHEVMHCISTVDGESGKNP